MAGNHFRYNPPPGFEGTDSFTYTIDNGFSQPAMGTVTITVSGMLWFIDNSAGAAGDGRLSSPFQELAGAGNSFAGIAMDEPGDNIFLDRNVATAYTGGLTLQDNQRLIGDGASSDLATLTGITPAPGSDPLPVFGGTDPLITTTNATAITLAQGNTIRGLTIGDTGTGTGLLGNTFGTLTIRETSIMGRGQAVDLTTGTLDVTLDSLSSTSSTTAVNLNGVSGTLTAPGGAISGATGTAFQVTGGNPTVTYSGTITNTAGRMIAVSNTTGGSVTFDTTTTNGLTDSGTGIEIADNDGSVSITNADLNGTGGVLIAENNTGPVTITNTTIDVTGDAFFVDGNTADVSSTIALTNVDITNPGGHLVRIEDMNGGSVDFDASSALTTTTGPGILVESNTNGTTVTFQSTTMTLTTGANPAVTLTDNTGMAIHFTGGNLDIDTTTGTGFSATGGGTVTVQGMDNVINSAAATALNVTNTTIGVFEMTFRSISSGNNTAATDPVSGIVLNNTGVIGGLMVTGDGSNARNASGGTIQNTTSHGIDLTDTQDFSITSLDIPNPGSGAGDQHGINATNLRGSDNLVRTARFSSVSDPTGDAIRVRNMDTNLGKLEVNDSLFTGVNGGGNDGILFDMKGTSIGRLDVTNNSHFDGLRGDGVQVLADDDSMVTTNILNSRFSNDSNIQPGGVGGASASRLSLRAADGSLPQTTGGLLTATISGNVFNDTGVQNGALPVGLVGVLDILGDQSASITTTISGNTIQNIEEDGAIRLIFDDSSSGTHLVDGNTVSSVNEPAVFFQARDTAGVTHLIVRNNNFGAGADGSPGGGGDDLPVGTENANFNEDTIRILVQEVADTSNIKIVNNDMVNNSSSQVLDVDSEDSAVLNLTVHNNRMTNIGNNGEAFDIEADNGGQICLDLNGDNVPGNRNTLQQGGDAPEAEGVIDHEADGGTYSIEDLMGGTSAATVDTFLTARNTFNNDLKVEGGPFSSVLDCTEPILPP